MATIKCGRCGSEKIMPNLRIRDRYDAGVGQDLEVEGQANPDALIFKQAHREALRAQINLYLRRSDGINRTVLQTFCFYYN